jgi:hypothetical protein
LYTRLFLWPHDLFTSQGNGSDGWIEVMVWFCSQFYKSSKSLCSYSFLDTFRLKSWNHHMVLKKKIVDQKKFINFMK